MRSSGAGLALAIWLTMAQTFCLAVSMTGPMEPEQSMQKTTSMWGRSGGGGAGSEEEAWEGGGGGGGGGGVGGARRWGCEEQGERCDGGEKVPHAASG